MKNQSLKNWRFLFEKLSDLKEDNLVLVQTSVIKIKT